MEKLSLGSVLDCCRCCLSKDGHMKNMFDEIYQISKHDYDTVEPDFRIEKPEIFESINLLQALSMIGIDMNADESITWQQICEKCEVAVKFCLEFQQQCIRSLNVLKNIKDENGVAEEGHVGDDERLQEDVKSVITIESGKKATKTIVKKPIKKSTKNRKPVKKPLKMLEISADNSDVDDNHYEQATPEYDNDEIDDVKTEYDATVKSPESTVAASYICYYCGLCFSTFTSFCQHRDSHQNGGPKAFVAIKRVCNLCCEPTEAYIQHLFEIHPKYKPNKCLQCDASFLHQYDLRDHLVKHLKTRIYECRACSHSFNHPKSLSTHIRTHYDENVYNCPACGLPKSKIADIVQHRNEEHADDEAFQTLFPCYACKKVFCKSWTFDSHKCNKAGQSTVKSESTLLQQCALCSEQFEDMEQYECHYIICENQRNYITCNLCNIQFNTRRSYRSHQKSQHRPKEFICEICSREFSHRKYLQAHSFSHSDNKTEQCPVCLKYFKTKFQLFNHKKIHKERMFECAKCGKRFPSKDILKVHLFKHFKSLSRESCTLCNKMFMGASQLRLHMRIHTGDKAYKCELCNKFYYTLGALKYHNEKVHQQKRYVCKFCNKQFAAIKSIHEHAFQHKGYFPFNCTNCQKKFTRKDAFKKHLREHNIKYDEEVHGFHGETFRDLIMFVLKNPKIEFADVDTVNEVTVETSEVKMEGMQHSVVRLDNFF